MKRTPLVRVTPLARRAALRTSRLSAEDAYKSAPQAIPPRRRRARTDTGFPPAVKLAVRARAGGGDPERAACEACAFHVGRYGGEIQHRVARGRGGTRRPVINTIVNAALLCSHCHRLAESRDADMYGAGWWLKSWQDPACEPVLLNSETRSGMLAWLAPDGTYSYTPPEGWAA